MCLKPVAWKISATEGYRISKSITRVTELLYIDSLKIFAVTSESKLQHDVDKDGQVGYGRCGTRVEPQQVRSGSCEKEIECM